MTHLKELRLRGLKRVKDASADAADKLPQLTSLSVRGSRVFRDGVAQMKPTMPETFILK